MNKKFKICFISRQAYPYLSGKNYKSAGGSELQETLLAKELVKRGNTASFIVGDYDQENFQLLDKIELYKGFFSFNKGALVKILEPIYLWNLLSKINADVYYRRTPNDISLIVALFCRLKRKKFIFAAGSDTHFQEEGLNKMGIISRFIYKQSSRLAHSFIVQNSFQKERAKELFGIDAILIKNLMEIPEGLSIKKDKPIVLFVGSILGYKQPEIFIELAKKIKKTNFYFIGHCNDKGYNDYLKVKSNNISNLKFCDFLPRKKILDIYVKDIVLVNTSKFEGFPNTFLEAWAYGNPVVSLNVDPDEVICRYKLGFHSKDFDRMIEELKILISDKVLREELGINGRKYVEENHDIEKIVDEYIEIYIN